MSGYLPDGTSQVDIDRAIQNPYECPGCGNDAADCVCFELGAAEEDIPMPQDGAERYEVDWLEIRDSMETVQEEAA